MKKWISVSTEDDVYLVGHVADALATDPRVGEQGLSVTIAGGCVYVRGSLPTPERRRAISEVVTELCPGLEVRNETTVGTIEELDAPEDVSG